MIWTVLRVVEGGVILYEGHRSRVSDVAAFDAWARTAPAGVYAFDEVAHRRSGSTLCDGLRPGVAVSPVASQAGLLPKPRPPCVYDDVRRAGSATLLTSADGAEIFEAADSASSMNTPPCTMPASWYRRESTSISTTTGS